MTIVAHSLPPVVLFLAILPFIYYVLAIFSAFRFFHRTLGRTIGPDFTPPVSNLKPVRGLDPDAYENFASFCRQDYPNYEIVFCVGTADDPVLPVIEKLRSDFPERRIRVLFGSGRAATNDKVAKLARLASEAEYEHLVISDSDVRVKPDYLRRIVSPLANPNVGAVTCLYVSTGEQNFVENLQSIGMISDFYPGLLVARQLDGVKFALGPTIATTRSRLAEFGGYQTIENRPADDLLVGRLIAEQGHEIELSSYTIETVADYQSLRDLVHKRLRWLVVMRHMRPWGHLGLLFTQGLSWSVLAVLLTPSWLVAIAYLGTYLILRLTLTGIVGIWGLEQAGLSKRLLLVPVWDAVAFTMWVASFARKTVRWRGGDYYIRDGMLVPATSASSGD
ncbi:MAG: bacteriohopanetetrol glucosamine biosynthesis glycosyltransferase HpnI [Acidobacteriaceae bacterium]|nr:bacteriohopanetetrol glucosamine biosynthesis glycosyltransferase HpnI [Acidobacteriaceae bacterium]